MRRFRALHSLQQARITKKRFDATDEDSFSILRAVLLIRRFRKAGQLYGLGLIGGFSATCISARKRLRFEGLQSALVTGKGCQRDHRLPRSRPYPASIPAMILWPKIDWARRAGIQPRQGR
jgi:hypothetical protein